MKQKKNEIIVFLDNQYCWSCDIQKLTWSELLARDSNISGVPVARPTEGAEVTLCAGCKSEFISGAAKHVEPDLPSNGIAHLACRKNTGPGSVETKLVAGHPGIVGIKVGLANGSPEVVVTVFQSTSVVTGTILQSDASLSACCSQKKKFNY